MQTLCRCALVPGKPGAKSVEIGKNERGRHQMMLMTETRPPRVMINDADFERAGTAMPTDAVQALRDEWRRLGRGLRHFVSQGSAA
jgi:hypothetical protein